MTTSQARDRRATRNVNQAAAPQRAADLLASLGVALAGGAALAGLFVPGLYRDVPAWVQQARGADLSTVALAIPLFVVGLWAARRGAIEGRLLALGLLAYLGYTYAVAAFSVAINSLTVAYIAVLGLSAWSGLLSAVLLDTPAARRLVDDRLPRRATAAFLLVVGLLFGLLWLGQLGGVVLTGEPPEELARLGLPTNPIYTLDLAFFLPACIVGGIGLLRGHALRSLAPVLLVFAALMGAEILGGFLFAALAGDAVPVPVAVVIGSIATLSAALSWRALRPRRAAVDRVPGPVLAG